MSNGEDLVQRLAALSLFQGVSDRHIQETLDMAGWDDVEAGTPVLRQGATDRDVLVLVEGRFDVVVSAEGHETVVNQVKAGDIVGASAMFRSAVERSASVIASTPALVLRLDAQGLDTLASSGNPVPQRIELRLLRALPGRIRRSLDRIDTLLGGDDGDLNRSLGGADEEDSVVGRLKGMLGL